MRILNFGCCILALRLAFRYCIVPGMGGSKIFNSQNKKIWPPDNPLKIKDLDLVINNGEIMIPKARKVGNLDSIKIDSTTSYLLTKNVYYSTMIKKLTNDKHSLFALPYDFRFSVYPQYYESLYLEFKSFFEEQFTKSQEPFIIVCHSLGGLVFHHFLSNFVDEAWISKHIQKIYFINVPFGGTEVSLFIILDHLYKNNLKASTGTPIISKLSNKIKNLHLFGGLTQTLPLDIDTDIENIFENYPQVSQNYQLFKKFHLRTRNNCLDVPIHIIYSTGKNTFISYRVENHSLITGDGDGLISKRSLEYPLRAWTRNKNIQYTEIKGQDHSGINNYFPLLEIISKNI